MSLPISPSPYAPYLKWSRAAVADCHQTMTQLSADHPCYAALEVCAQQLNRAVRLMESCSPFTTRYLVDCAETCAYCARRCAEFPNCPHCTEARRICRDGVGVLRRGSFL